MQTIVFVYIQKAFTVLALFYKLPQKVYQRTQAESRHAVLIKRLFLKKRNTIFSTPAEINEDKSQKWFDIELFFKSFCFLLLSPLFGLLSTKTVSFTSLVFTSLILLSNCLFQTLEVQKQNCLEKATLRTDSGQKLASRSRVCQRLVLLLQLRCSDFCYRLPSNRPDARQTNWPQTHSTCRSINTELTQGNVSAW